MINNKDIQENGKLICEFLKLSIRDKRAKSNPVYYIPFSTIMQLDYCPQGGDPSIEQDTDIRASETLFHSDWTWTIELVNKFKEVWREEEFESMSRETDKLAQNIHIDTLNIENTYKAVVEFIKWYNTQKKCLINNNL